MCPAQTDNPQDCTAGSYCLEGNEGTPDGKCKAGLLIPSFLPILLTKTTAAQNEGTLRYHKVRGLYIQAVVFAATIADASC